MKTTLTDIAVKNAKPKSKPYKLHDFTRGVFILVNTDGSKWIRFRYPFEGKDQLLSLGTYPNTGLATARLQAAQFRVMLKDGVNPSAERKAAKKPKVADAPAPLGKVFQEVALEFVERYASRRASEFEREARQRLENHVFPIIGTRRIADLQAPDILPVLHRMENQGLTASVPRMKRFLSQIFRTACCLSTELQPLRPIASLIRPSP